MPGVLKADGAAGSQARGERRQRVLGLLGLSVVPRTSGDGLNKALNHEPPHMGGLVERGLAGTTWLH